jgi:hypothetical protein
MKMNNKKIISEKAFERCPYNYRLMELRAKTKPQSSAYLVVEKHNITPVIPFYKTISR